MGHVASSDALEGWGPLAEHFASVLATVVADRPITALARATGEGRTEPAILLCTMIFMLRHVAVFVGRLGQ